MLIKCPECELQVSDKALSCPHCGFPMQPTTKPRKPRSKNNKRRRLPNGFGQISEIKNRNLRKPFRAMVTVGKTEEGRPICKPLKPDSYFETYNDAYAALVEYNKNPYDLEPAITAEELYERWSDEYFKTLTASTIGSIKLAWRYCSAVYKIRVCDIRARHIKGCMENGVYIIKGVEHHPTPTIKNRIKSIFNLMLDYAVEYEIVDRNYARTFTLDDEIMREIAKTQKEHIAFTDEEMAILWENINVPFVDAILVQCYSGWRPRELGSIELANVDLEKGIMRGGMKTEAGIGRIVPIHSKIYPLIEKRYAEAVELNSKYLFNYTGGASKNNLELTYPRYSKTFYENINKLGLNKEHRPHDGRTHFITAAKKAGVDEYAIKYIVGHSIDDITEKVYTKREYNWLKEEIEKIK